MFSKILRSAKTALQPAAPAALQYPETDLFPPTPAPKTPARSNMVTTRNRARAVIDLEADIATPSAQIQASSRKRRRIVSTPSASQDNVEPSSSAKKRKLPTSVTNSPVIDLQSEEEEAQVLPSSKRRRSSVTTVDVKVNVQIQSPEKLKSEISLLSEDEGESKPISSSQQVHSLLSDENEEVVQPKSSQVNSKTPARVSKSPKAKILGDDVPAISGEDSSKTEQVPVVKEEVKLPAPKHRRFGDEQPVLEVPSSDPNDRDEASEEEEDSDDEAPEEVGTREAADEAKKVVRAAAKAVEEQRAAERKSRQERDLAMKKQAELNKKRKRKSTTEEDQDEVDDDGTASDAKQAESVPAAEQIGDNDITMEDRPAETVTIELTKSHKIDKNNLPDLLPLEYLEDTPGETTTLTTSETAQPKPKKTKFLDRVEKKLKDKRKGSTTYRVQEAKEDSRLAPKASKSAMSLKEAWLSGGVRKNGKGGSARKPMKSGFFVNGKSGAGRR